MADHPRRYDSLWSTYNAADLKKASVVWGASKLPKYDCIAFLHSALKDPNRIDKALARMEPHQRTALGILKLFGGAADIDSLAHAIRATGMAPALERTNWYYRGDPLGKSLIERGIVMLETGYRNIDYSYSESNKRVFADERILARIGRFECKPLALTAVETVDHATYRRVQSVVLDVISILRIVNDIGGVGLTKAGGVRIPDIRKVARKIGWGEEIAFDGLTFPEPARAYVSALMASGLLSDNSETHECSGSLEQTAGWPAAEILRSLVSGILHLPGWVEYKPNSSIYYFEEHCSQGRLAILAALRCLPDRRTSYRFNDFEHALFDRIGETYSVAGVPGRPVPYGRSADEQRAGIDKWRSDLRASWEKHTLPWLQAVFQTWLYAFGLVELSLTHGAVDRFHLTDVGRAILWGEPSEKAVLRPAAPTPAWVVQPNFDVVVYLDSATTEQLAFLAQHAEHGNAAQHTAQYRLTRDSIYEGLQRGTSVDRLIEGLAAGSRVELPGNVVSEIRTWAALRERISVRRRANLIEFPDAAARQSAIERGVPGTAVADRFLLLPASRGEAGVAGVTPEIIDYADRPAKGCLQVSEEGLVTLSSERRDLLTLGTLDLWAEREGDAAWRLTRKSVTAALQRGRTLAELLNFLQDRMRKGLPGLLSVALCGWAGEPATVDIADIVILQCSRHDVLDALIGSQALKPHLIGRIGHDTVIVNRAELDAVRAVLEWAGVRSSAKIKGP